MWGKIEEILKNKIILYKGETEVTLKQRNDEIQPREEKKCVDRVDRQKKTKKETLEVSSTVF